MRLVSLVGLLPERDHGAHAHVAPCGPLPIDAARHFLYVQGAANSIVLPDHDTSTEPGTAGSAGPRHGCCTVAF